MNINLELAGMAVFLCACLVVTLRYTMRLMVTMDRRRPPLPARAIGSAVTVGGTLPAPLLAAASQWGVKSWPEKSALFILRGSCEPCDELRPEVFAAARSYQDFVFFVDGWQVAERLPGNILVVPPGLFAKMLGISVSPAIVVATSGEVRAVALVNAGGQIEAALRSVEYAEDNGERRGAA